MTLEDSCLIGTDLMVYHDVDYDDDDETRNLITSFVMSFLYCYDETRLGAAACKGPSAHRPHDTGVGSRGH
jgi:hypothetical protein